MCAKKLVSIAIVLLLTTSFSLAAGCSRQPSAKRTTSIMQGFFHKYSKKHPESMLGKSPVKNIQILETEEIHKNLVAVYAVLELEGGIPLQVRFTIQKKPFGWRAISWENMGLALRQTP